MTTWENKNDTAFIYHTFSKVNEKFWVLLTSDVHKDSKKCDKRFLKKILDEARERNAIIIDNGDWFDVMGGKYDKRTSKSDILPKFQEGNYFDLVVEDSEEFLAPYADMIAVLGEGNHEQSVNQRHERNLTKNLIKALKPHGCKAIHQKYDGFIRFKFKFDGTVNSSIDLYRNHGFGGNSPVTMGVINTNRSQVNVDADIYVYGHIHQKWIVQKTRKYSDMIGQVKTKDQIHVQLSTFKDTKEGQWEISKGMSSPSLGAAWLCFTYHNTQTDGVRTREIKTEAHLINM